MEHFVDVGKGEDFVIDCQLEMKGLSGKMKE